MSTATTCRDSVTNSADRSANIAFETSGNRFAHRAHRFIHRARVHSRGHASAENYSRERLAAWRGFRIAVRPSGEVHELARGPTPVPRKWGEEDVMDARLRRRLEMAVRVRDFLPAHRTD